MKVVLDTNVIIAGLRSKNGASYQLLRLMLQGRIDFLLSVPLILEYEAVMKRPENLQASRLNLVAVEEVLNAVCFAGMETDIHYLWRPQLSDPKDDMVLELAVNGQADAIITFNVTDFKKMPDHLGIELLKPGIGLHRLKQSEV